MQPDDGGPEYRILVPSHTWFIGRLPRPATLRATAEGIMNAVVTFASGKQRTMVPVFTDSDLAESFLARQDSPLSHKPFTVGTLLETAAVFFALRELGETHLIFDPEPALRPDKVLSIAEAMVAISQAQMDHGS